MSELIEKFDEESFIKDFIKKLENILRKAPVQAKAKIFKSVVEINIMGFNDLMIFNIDFSKPVKENLFLLKSKLFEGYYPSITFIEEKTESYSSKEIEALIESGIPLSEALSKQKVTKIEKTYKISRILIPKDELFLKRIDEEDELLYKMKMPLSIFLKRMREKWTKEETSKMFKKYAEFERIIYPPDVWKELNKETTRVTIEELNDKKRMD